MSGLSDNSAGLRLLKKGRHGLLRAIFSRAGLLLILMLLQILLFVVVFGRLRIYLPHYVTIGAVFSSVMALYLLNSRHDNSTKITWIVIIMLLPVVGALLYLYTRSDVGHRLLRDRYVRLSDAMRDSIPQDPETVERFRQEEPDAVGLSNYVNRTGRFPVYDRTDVRYFPLGDDMFPVLLEELEKAEEDYQKQHGFTESDMAALKTGDVEQAVPIFLGTDDPVYKGMFSMGVKNMYRLVDTHVYIGKAYTARSIKDEVLGYQAFHGDQQAVVAISGKYDDVRKMAISYTKEEFIETKEDALDAICELINCINGLYATEKSKQDTRIELDPPNFNVSYAEALSEEMFVLPVYICGGEVKYIIAVSKDIVVG